MKKLLKIGILILFMIGLFTVQLDFKPLIDDDVGTENVDIAKFINYNFPDNVVISNLEIPDQVASPLKHPLFELQSNLIISNSEGIHTGLTAINNENTLNKQFVYEANLRKGYSINVPEADKIMRTFRLDIGEDIILNVSS